MPQAATMCVYGTNVKVMNNGILEKSQMHEIKGARSTEKNLDINACSCQVLKTVQCVKSITVIIIVLSLQYMYMT